ncbi:hypothetical protein BZL29_1945 [Mycobacterium kansasii]|uniref:Uncharacterized protein n=1 Tax=Mycobacterium kansasii TaxID=1768 RepID=A0A1V3XPS8_MYCKA|nr:hypothetical protein BZL29_1945 [Mycobacterium kansasii]
MTGKLGSALRPNNPARSLRHRGVRRRSQREKPTGTMGLV